MNEFEAFQLWLGEHGPIAADSDEPIGRDGCPIPKWIGLDKPGIVAATCRFVGRLLKQKSLYAKGIDQRGFTKTVREAIEWERMRRGI